MKAYCAVILVFASVCLFAQQQPQQPQSAAEKLKAAQKKFTAAKRKLDDAKAAYDETIEKYFGEHANESDKDLYLNHERPFADAEQKYARDLQNTGKAFEKYKKVAANPRTKPGDLKDAKEDWEVFKAISDKGEERVDRAFDDLCEWLKEKLQGIDAKANTKIVEDFENAKHEEVWAKKEVEEARQAEETEANAEGKNEKAPEPNKPKEADSEDELQKLREEAAKEPMSGPPAENVPSPSPTETPKIDPCLIGTWTATSVKDNKPVPMSGGTGFKVTFKPDGHETVDYSGMKPFQLGGGDSQFIMMGSATAMIEARDGFAKIDKMEAPGVKMTMRIKTYGINTTKPFPDLLIAGPDHRGGIKYSCNGDTLTYNTFYKDKSDFKLTITMTRVKEAAAATSKPAQSPALTPTQGKPPRSADIKTELPKAFKKLPTGYKIVESPNDSRYFYAQWDGDSRPGLPITWDPERGVWRPPGFVSSPGDTDHISHSLSKEEAYWDTEKKRWISTKTGKVLGYEQ